MFGLGSLANFIGYFILSIPPICVLLFFGIIGKRSLKVWIIIFLISIAPLSFAVYEEYTEHLKEQLQHVGRYYLTEYPNCDSCILFLKSNLSYSVFKYESEIEQGKWRFRSGSDYFIVDIGEHGRLGTGNYTYHSYINGFEK